MSEFVLGGRTRCLWWLAVIARCVFCEGVSFISPLCSDDTTSHTEGVSALKQCGITLPRRALVQTSIRKRGSAQPGGREHHHGQGGRAQGVSEEAPKRFRRSHSHLQQSPAWEPIVFSAPSPAAAGLPEEATAAESAAAAAASAAAAAASAAAAAAAAAGSPQGLQPGSSPDPANADVDPWGHPYTPQVDEYGDPIPFGQQGDSVDRYAEDAGAHDAAGVVDVKPGFTDFTKSSCQQMPSDAKPSFKLSLGMTVAKCFHHCAGSPGAKFFALARGHECFCGSVPLGRIVSSKRCDVKCVGDPTEICGGVANVASAFSMIDCEPPSYDEEIAAENKKFAKLMSSYKVIEGRSCGHSTDNRIEIDGSPVMAGDPDQCAEACWDFHGAEECHGFTYDSTMEKCTFSASVADGDIVTKKGMKCYFKKILPKNFWADL